MKCLIKNWITVLKQCYTHRIFFFMGSEEGVNFYRVNEKEIWQRGGNYTIYVRMITK